MKRARFHFELPEHLIAQHPAPRREDARLLVVDASTGEWSHHRIPELPELLPPATLCVPNDVKVRHARLRLQRAGGGEGEALLLRVLADGAFEALVRPGARLRPGKSVQVLDGHTGAACAELLIEEALEEGLRKVRLHQTGKELDWDAVDRLGQLPLPPYIHHAPDAEDESRYQTTFHGSEGEAVAAPTAGLHFTPELIARLGARGAAWLPVRLHVGLGTFRPMTAEDTDDHVMHAERYEIPDDTASALERAFRQRSRPVLAIGTTALRTLETAWDGHSLRRSGSSQLFIRPGHRLRTANHLLTNFHLPESTLFMLVCALLGMETAHAAYQEAIRTGYRFFSYGDAMLLRGLQR